MAVDLRLRSGWEAEVLVSPGARRAAQHVAEKVAREATRLARQVSTTYEATVETSGDRVQVAARTRARQTSMNVAKSIEHGTWRFPAVAPLRRAAEAVGLKSGPAR